MPKTPRSPSAARMTTNLCKNYTRISSSSPTATRLTNCCTRNTRSGSNFNKGGLKQMNRKGFTLIELLIVVAIIAILAAIAVPNFIEAQARAKVSRTKSDMRAMATAIEAYAVDYNYYPLNGVLIAGGALQNPQTSLGGPPAHKFMW